MKTNRMPSKPLSKAVPGRELPKVIPGTPAQLLGIARRVVGLRVPGHPRPDSAQLQTVVDRLGCMGQDLLYGLQQQVTSPSADALATGLEQVQQHAQKLEEAIVGLPPFAQNFLNHAYRGQRHWNPDTRSFRDLGIGTAPAAVVASAIAAAATQHLESWQKGTVVGQVPPTQRGPMRAYQRIVGDPRTLLANQVALLVIAEQGAAAVTAEENGVVYAVVGELWEWATGLSDEDANLRKHIRVGVRYALLAARLNEVKTFIADEVTRHHAAVMADVATEITPSSQARLAHKRRLYKLEAEQERLTRKLLRSEPGQGKPEQGDTGPDTPAQEKIVPR